MSWVDSWSRCSAICLGVCETQTHSGGRRFGIVRYFASDLLGINSLLAVLGHLLDTANCAFV